jgi:O-antigen/teichoic acid export membrane protein
MSLKTQAIRGGLFLALRQSLGILIGLGGVLLLTRMIGPSQYGLYAATIGIYTYLQSICQLGISVYVVRSQDEDCREIYDQAFTLLLLLGIVGVSAGLLSLPLLEQWVRLEGFRAIAQAMIIGLPIALIAQVPLAKLERSLDYRRVATLELWNQLFFYVIALPIAFQAGNAWAPVAGWWAMQVQGMLLFFWGAGYRPKLCWNRELLREILSYSSGYSASVWIWQLRTLVNPLIVGRFMGAEAVGFVALAIRLVELLSFVKTATWRIALATLARFQNDRDRLRKAVSDGMNLQLLALGPLLTGFALVSPLVMPSMFGDQWLPVIHIYPFIALGSLSNALFNLHSSVLFVLKQNWKVTIFHSIHVFLFAEASFVLVPMLGLQGYGGAEIVALLSYWVVHRFLVQQAGIPNYRLSIVWWLAFSVSLFTVQFGWWVCGGLGLIALLPETHEKLSEVFGQVKGLRYRRQSD